MGTTSPATPAQKLESDRFRYPGMLADEILVYRVWLSLHQGEYDNFQYNVRLGPIQDPGPNFSQSVRDQTILANQLRIDAVAWQGQQPTIIEVKRRATAANIGQLTTYFHQWVSENLSQSQPKLLLVCAGYSANIVAAVRGSNIGLDQVNVSFASLSPKNQATTI